MENFPWTRLANVAMPAGQKPATELETIRQLDSKALRTHLKDGNWGGVYQRADEEMLKIWNVGLDETRELLGGNWA
jgi:creatinine amidohydrolase